MGMFDYIRYNGNVYQTKDTPAQLLDNYEIRTVGSLWYEDYDLEVIEDDSYFLKVYWEKRNTRWVFCSNFSGKVRFYRNLDKDYKVWEEYVATFRDGYLREIYLKDDNER